MPRVRVSHPSGAQVQKYPREFALYSQLNGDSTIDPQDLAAYAKKYGSKAAPQTNGDLAYDVVAATLQKFGPAVKEGSGNAVGYAAHDKSGKLSPMLFKRRPVGEKDVRIQITYCGVCHSDLHTIRSEWGTPNYPVIPGHEMVGIVTEVGSGVTSFKVGERAGVGCFVNSCRECECCKSGEDNYCDKLVVTYNGTDPIDNTPTQGGYSSHIVVQEPYVLRMPTNLPMAASAPLLCAGITTYSPLKHFGLDKPGLKLGVVGLGGLGHMAVKFGKAFGLEVTVISTSEKKKDEALNKLGADHFLVSKDADAMAKHKSTLDGIIDTVSAQHDIAPELDLLKKDGRLVFVGVPEKPLEFMTAGIAFKRKTISGSLIGGIRETQEMLDFCGKHNITCEIEEIEAPYINEAMDRLVKNDVHYRFVINVQGSIVLPQAN